MISFFSPQRTSHYDDEEPIEIPNKSAVLRIRKELSGKRELTEAEKLKIHALGCLIFLEERDRKDCPLCGVDSHLGLYKETKEVESNKEIVVQRIDGWLSDDLLDFKTILAFVPKGTNQKNLNFGAFIDSISIMSSEGEFRFFFQNKENAMQFFHKAFSQNNFNKTSKLDEELEIFVEEMQEDSDFNFLLD